MRDSGVVRYLEEERAKRIENLKIKTRRVNALTIALSTFAFVFNSLAAFYMALNGERIPFLIFAAIALLVACLGANVSFNMLGERSR